MPKVAIASPSQLAADAGARVAEEGGNAVDAAISAALVSVVTSPGLCSLGGAGFAVIGGQGATEAIDGGFEMPGRGLARGRFGGGYRDVFLEYGGGVHMRVGPGTVATPGLLALCALASERHGRLPWSELVEPSYEHAVAGFPLPEPSHEYLCYSHELVFGWNQDSFAALHDADDQLLGPGDRVYVPHLADSLRLIADEGARVFYEGELGSAISSYIGEHGGLITLADLAEYRATVRSPVTTRRDGWTLASNPPPAVGGVVLSALLQLLERYEGDVPTGEWISWLARVQETVLSQRERRLDSSDSLEAEAESLLADVAAGTVRVPESSATVHTSTVDSDGLACAITLSDGYGSGTMPPETGIWLNNCLGETELNPHGYHGWRPGRRLLSNMAPTLALHDSGNVLAIGSPGADRITTALIQVLENFLRFGMSLQAAIDHPRLHVELTDEGPRVAYEPGISGDDLPFPERAFDGPNMYFGGVAAALWDPESGFQLAADRRRAGAVAVGGR